ncbi:hypothetical protein Anae109_3245 [Anaeromyxobacter sp. Fw109-5]|nr:hypothetical protein Anae109_3245 [Anaeromyxobacter sp. Fw109-5]
MQCILAHPDLQGLRRVMLVTHDPRLYLKAGFTALKEPETYMGDPRSGRIRAHACARREGVTPSTRSVGSTIQRRRYRREAGESSARRRARSFKRLQDVSEGRHGPHRD